MLEDPVGKSCDAANGHQSGADAAKAREPRRRQCRALTHGRDRRDARRANRRPQTREQRHEDSDQERDDHGCPGEEHEAGVRKDEADEVEEAEKALREEEPFELPLVPGSSGMVCGTALSAAVARSGESGGGLAARSPGAAPAIAAAMAVESR